MIRTGPLYVNKKFPTTEAEAPIKINTKEKPLTKKRVEISEILKWITDSDLLEDFITAEDAGNIKARVLKRLLDAETAHDVAPDWWDNFVDSLPVTDQQKSDGKALADTTVSRLEDAGLTDTTYHQVQVAANGLRPQTPA